MLLSTTTSSLVFVPSSATLYTNNLVLSKTSGIGIANFTFPLGWIFTLFDVKEISYNTNLSTSAPNVATTVLYVSPVVIFSTTNFVSVGTTPVVVSSFIFVLVSIDVTSFTSSFFFS